MLRLFLREASRGADRLVVAEHLGVRVLDGHREDVLLDELEEVQVWFAAM